VSTRIDHFDPIVVTRLELNMHIISDAELLHLQI
jgi:hypothetical protein